MERVRIMPRRQERLVVTLPPDPGLARLARRVAQHFLRQQGLGAAAARKGARAVERRCRRILEAAAAAARSRRPLVLVLTSTGPFLEVLGPRRASGTGRRLCRFQRPQPC